MSDYKRGDRVRVFDPTNEVLIYEGLASSGATGTVLRLRNGKVRVEIDNTGSQDTEGNNVCSDFDAERLSPLPPPATPPTPSEAEEKCPVCCVPGRTEGHTTRHFVSHHFAIVAELRNQLADKSGLRGLTLEMAEAVLTKKEAQLAAANALLAVLREALEKIASETIYTYDDGNEGPYIKYRAKLLSRDALSKVREVGEGE